MKILSQQRLKELLHYDTLTGHFTWLKPTTNRVQPGELAGTINAKGYRIIKIDGRLYRAYRLAWLFVHGAFPTLDLDHRDQNKDNNAIGNLRLATNEENHGNRGVNKNNKLGIKGVCLSKGKYLAQIHVRGKSIFLGRFDTSDAAQDAYRQAAQIYFGEFAA